MYYKYNLSNINDDGIPSSFGGCFEIYVLHRMILLKEYTHLIIIGQLSGADGGPSHLWITTHPELQVNFQLLYIEEFEILLNNINCLIRKVKCIYFITLLD